MKAPDQSQNNKLCNQIGTDTPFENSLDFLGQQLMSRVRDKSRETSTQAFNPIVRPQSREQAFLDKKTAGTIRQYRNKETRKLIENKYEKDPDVCPTVSDNASFMKVGTSGLGGMNHVLDVMNAQDGGGPILNLQKIDSEESPALRNIVS